MAAPLQDCCTYVVRRDPKDNKPQNQRYRARSCWGLILVQKKYRFALMSCHFIILMSCHVMSLHYSLSNGTFNFN